MNRRCCLLLAALTLAPQSSCQESFNTTGDELFGGDFFGSGGMENPCIACPEGLPEGAVDTVVTIDGEDDTCANWINDGFISFLEGGTDYCYLSKAPIESACCPEQVKELADPCMICPNGITEGEDTALIDETTCGELESTSSTISAGGILCESYKLSAFTCCPADASFGSWLGESSNVTNPCNLCPNGVIDESALVMAPGDDPENASTCAESLPLYSSLEKESDQCLYSSTLVQQSCCPEEANPCEICPGGVSDGAVLPGDEGEEKLLCSEVVESGMFLPANSEVCESTKVVASFCCPGDVQQQANPCSICPNGVTIAEGGDFILGDEEEGEITCNMAVSLSNSVDKESELCSEISEAQLLCCPGDVPDAADPCPFCPGGISAAAGTIIPDSGGLTCERGIAFAKTVDKSNEMCSDIQMAQLTCCLGDVPAAADPCQFCPGGLTVEESTPVIGAPNGETCGMLLGFAAAFEEGDALCTQMKPAALLCCPGGSGAEDSTEDAMSEAGGTAPEAPSGETDTAVEEVDASSTGDSTEASTETETADPVEEPGTDPAESEPPSVGFALGSTQLLGSWAMAVSIAYLL